MRITRADYKAPSPARCDTAGGPWADLRKHRNAGAIRSAIRDTGKSMAVSHLSLRIAVLRYGIQASDLHKRGLLEFVSHVSQAERGLVDVNSFTTGAIR